MNLRRSLVTGLAAIGLMASVAAPVALAQAPPADENSGNNTATASVTVQSDGVFDVFFATTSVAFGTTTLNAANLEPDLEGSFTIGYTDTKSNRPRFDVTVIAGHFSDGSGNFIHASNLTVERTENVIQQFWGGPGRCDTPPNSGNLDPAKVAAGCNPTIDIGDIGYFHNGGYIGQTPAGVQWDPKTFSMEDWLKVHFGYGGAGTGNSTGVVGVNLHVPATTVPGVYTSTLTVNVVTGTQP